MPIEPMLYRPAEAAEALGLSRSTIYELIAAGALPVVKVGGCTRIPVDQLRAWIAAQAESRRTEAA